MASLLNASGTFLQGVAESVVFAFIVFTSLFARLFGPWQGGRLAKNTAQPPRTFVSEKREDEHTDETDIATVPCPQTPRNAPVNQGTDNIVSTPQSQMVGIGPIPGTPLPGHPTTTIVATCTTSPPSSPTPMRPRNLEASLMAVVPIATYTTDDCKIAGVKHCDDHIAVSGPGLWKTEDHAQDMVQAVPTEESAVAAATLPTCLTPSSPPLSFYDVPRPNLICAIEMTHVGSDGELLYDITLKASTPSATVNMGAAAPTIARPVHVAAGGIIRGGYGDEKLEQSIPQPIFPSPFKTGNPNAADEVDCTEVGVPQMKSALGGADGNGKVADAQAVATPLEAIPELPDTHLWSTAAGEHQLEPSCTLPGQELAEHDASSLLEQCTGATLSDASLAVQELVYSVTMATPVPFASAVTIAVDAVSNTATRDLHGPFGDQGAITAKPPSVRRSSFKKPQVSLEPALAAAATAPQPETGDKALDLRGSRLQETSPVKTISTPSALQHAHCSCCHSAVEVLGAVRSGVPQYAAPTVSSLARRSPRAAVKIAAQRGWDSYVGLRGVQSYAPEHLSMRRTLVSPLSVGVGGRGAPASAGNGGANVVRRRGAMLGQLPNRG